MKISESIRKAYPMTDPEADFFLDHFDEPAGCRILEVGAHDAPLCSMFVDAGFQTVGFDLRPYDHKPVKHLHYAADFSNAGLAWWQAYKGYFDAVVSVSAIEHFGLGTYGELGEHPFGDVLAMREIWKSLRPGGVAYISVPIGGRFLDYKPHWRVYDHRALMERIASGFKVEWVKSRICEEFKIQRNFFGGEVGVAIRRIGEEPTLEDIAFNQAGFPGISALLKLRKAVS